MYLASQILKAALVPTLILLPAPGPGIQRDAALDIDRLRRAECEYRGISASYDEVTRAYILQAYEGGALIRWQARPSPFNPDSETLVTAIFAADGAKTPGAGTGAAQPRTGHQSAGITWRYSTLASVRVTPHGAYAQDAMAVFRQTVDGYVDRMAYAPAAVALRAAAAPEARILAEVAASEVLLIEERRGAWLRVRHPASATQGWLPRQQVRAVGN